MIPNAAPARRPLRTAITASLRAQVLLALLLTLLIAVGATALIDRQVTGNRLRTEAQALLQRNLDVVSQLVADRRSEQLSGLRTAVQNLQVLGLSAADEAPRLRQVVVDTRRQLALDGIALVTTDGQVLASSGHHPVDTAPLLDRPGGASGSAIVPAVDGGVIEVSSVPVSPDLWLLGSRVFGDTTAFAFRRVVGNDVVLLHDDQIRGSTLATQEALPAILAAAPVSVEVVDGGRRSLAGFASIGDDTHVAVVTPQLLAGLQRDLTVARLLSLLGLMLAASVIGVALIRRITRPLVELSHTAEAVRRGDVDTTFGVQSSDEIGRLGQTLESMRQALGDQLGVISLQADAIRRATQRIVTARDVERRRMAQDLHDGVQQQLVMLRLRIGMLDDDTSAAERASLGREVEAVIQRLRETGRAIFPSILADRGIAGAVYSLAAASPVPVDVDLQPDPVPRLAEAVEAGTYFIIAEATSNVLKHAGASRIRVRVRVRGTAGSEPTSLLVVVADDGQGFDVSPDVEGAGMQNLHDRAVALGGVAHIRSVPGRGTAVAVRIPLQGRSVGRPLQEEQHRSDAAVEVVGVAEAELSEDGVGVLLHGAFGDHQAFGDR